MERTVCSQRGSSPRVWGQGKKPIYDCDYYGIIPTRVGTSFPFSFHQVTCSDHPHACGDKFNSRDFMNKNAGSSPRVWGQAPTTILKTKAIRIIPTRVGTSYTWRCCLVRCQDHPHACGDKRGSLCAEWHRGGSSPRVWGQDICVTRVELLNGIIPTRVGTSIPSKAIMCRS